MKMNLLRKRIRDMRTSTGIGWEIVEQDYVLSWVLFGIANVERLQTTLVFKGGTALKKCYFGNYRFSQDLDFSIQGNNPTGEELLMLVREACLLASNRVEDVDFKCERYAVKEPHPEQQEAFVIHARLPWHRDFHTVVKVEVTMQEPVLLVPHSKPIIHGYGETLEAQINVYQIEEIVAEKIRAILQFAKKLFERGWGRSRVRDYYDLWRILREYGPAIDRASIPGLVKRKCDIKDVVFNGIDDIFQSRLMEILKKDWDQWLSPIVPMVPEREELLIDLRAELEKIWL